MNSLVKNLVIGAATLAIASAPLVASAQDWHHNGDNNRNMHGRIVQRNNGHYYGHPMAHRWNEGYYGMAPGGFRGYYHNGGWFHHRRMHNGIFIYF